MSGTVLLEENKFTFEVFCDNIWHGSEVLYHARHDSPGNRVMKIDYVWFGEGR